ncbi:MAG: SlyX family protein [Deltaproteobacteria bacterium]|jgi:SlyX protein|nr:SlyX family protein [Deltaproteobacteria bacterium]
MTEQQLEDLQIRLTHQEMAIEALNRAVTQQDGLIAQLRADLAQVRQMLHALQPSPLGDATTEEPPPPHY